MTSVSPSPVPSAARWSTVGQLGGQALRFVVLIVLAKLLSKADFGLFEIALYVMGFVEVIKSVGTSEFLITSKDPQNRLLSSVFWVNVVAGFGMSAILWLVAPLITVFGISRGADVVPLIQWLGLSFAILSTSHVHEALLRKELKFKRLAIALFCGPLAYACGAIPAALSGWQAMSFVAGGLAEAVTVSIVLWLASSFRPRSGFSVSEARKAFHFSFFLTASEIVRWLTSMSDRIIIYGFLGLEALGVYGLARRLLHQATKPMLLVFHKVVLPALAQFRGDDDAMRRKYVRACAGMALISFPAMAGIAVLARPFVAVIDPVKWAGTVSLISILAPAVALQTIASTVGVIYLLKSRTDWLLAWSIVSGALIAAGYYIGAQSGLAGVAWMTTAVTVVLLWPAFAIPLRLVDIEFRHLWRALVPCTLMTLVMTSIVFGVRTVLDAFGVNAPAELAITALTGIAVYAALVPVLRPPGLEDLLDVIPGELGNKVRVLLRAGPRTMGS